MRTKVTKKWLQNQAPCKDVLEYWMEQNKPDLFEFTRQCIKDDHCDWANWLMVRCMDRGQYLKYVLHAVDLVEPIYRKYCPDSTVVVDAIQAVAACIRTDSKENMDVAANVANASVDAGASAAINAAQATVRASFCAADNAAYAVVNTIICAVINAAYSASVYARGASCAGCSVRTIYKAYCVEAAACVSDPNDVYVAADAFNEMFPEQIRYGMRIMKADKKAI